MRFDRIVSDWFETVDESCGCICDKYGNKPGEQNRTTCMQCKSFKVDLSSDDARNTPGFYYPPNTGQFNYQTNCRLALPSKYDLMDAGNWRDFFVMDCWQTENINNYGGIKATENEAGQHEAATGYVWDEIYHGFEGYQTAPTPHPTFDPSENPTTHPTQNPTTSLPTPSPTFTDDDICVNIWSRSACEKSDCSSPVPGEHGLLTAEACCNCNSTGGKLALAGSDILLDQELRGRISSDMKLHDSLSLSFWADFAKGGNHLIVEFTQELSAKRRNLQEADDTVISFISVVDNRLVWDFPFSPQLSGETDGLNTKLRGGYHSVQLSLSGNNGFTHMRVFVDGEEVLNKQSSETVEYRTVDFAYETYDDYDYGSLEFLPFTLNQQYADALFLEHKDSGSWPADSATPYIIIPIIIAGTAFIITTMSYCLALSVSADTPQLGIMFAVTLAFISITTDVEFLIRMFDIDHKHKYIVLAATALPFLLTGCCLSCWYVRKAASDDFLGMWLYENRKWSVMLLVLSFFNVKIMSLGWSKLAPMTMISEFRMPVDHQQQLELAQFRVITLVFQEIPMLVLQLMILLETSYASDPTTVTITRISFLSSCFFLVYSVINMIVGSTSKEKLIFYQDVLVLNPKKNLLKKSHHFSSAFKNTPVLIHRHAKDQFMIRFAFADGSRRSREKMKKRIKKAMEKYSTRDTTLEFQKADHQMEETVDASVWRDRFDDEYMTAGEKTNQGMDMILGAANRIGGMAGEVKIDTHKGRPCCTIHIPFADDEHFEAFEQKLASHTDYEPGTSKTRGASIHMQASRRASYDLRYINESYVSYIAQMDHESTMRLEVQDSLHGENYHHQEGVVETRNVGGAVEMRNFGGAVYSEPQSPSVQSPPTQTRVAVDSELGLSGIWRSMDADSLEMTSVVHSDSRVVSD